MPFFPHLPGIIIYIQVSCDKVFLFSLFITFYTFLLFLVVAYCTRECILRGIKTRKERKSKIIVLLTCFQILMKAVLGKWFLKIFTIKRIKGTKLNGFWRFSEDSKTPSILLQLCPQKQQENHTNLYNKVSFVSKKQEFLWKWKFKIRPVKSFYSL